MPPASATWSRRYQGADDLPALLAFASRTLAERAPLGAAWHPGDVIWELRGQYDTPQPMRLWGEATQVHAVAWFVGPGQLWLECVPSAEAWTRDILAWAEQAMRRSAGGPTLSVRALERDRRRIEALEHLGYRRGELDGVWFELDLTSPPPTAPPPAGFALVDCVAVDAAVRAAAHRDAWNDLRRIGIDNADSNFSAGMYQSIRDSPGYDPSLDLAVLAPDGRMVATSIAWADDASGIGIFEPMGTHPEFRGRRLAAALLCEGARRLRSRGCRTARIGTAHFNAPAISAYGALFPQVDRTAWWTKPL